MITGQETGKKDTHHPTTHKRKNEMKKTQK